MLDNTPKVSVNVQNEKLSTVLTRVFTNTGIKYEAFGKQVVLTEDLKARQTSPSVSEAKIEAETPFEIAGKVENEEGEPLIGASVTIKGTTKGTVTKDDGTYKFTVTTDDKRKILVISYVGFQTVEEPIKGRNVIDIVLKEGSPINLVLKKQKASKVWRSI